MKRRIQRGQSYPLGATVSSEGVNFSIYSKSATALELLLFDDVDSPRPDRVIPLSPSENRTFHYWHGIVTDLESYLDAQARVDQLHADQKTWARKAILNVARMGKFSSDRTIREYAQDIWRIAPVL